MGSDGRARGLLAFDHFIGMALFVKIPVSSVYFYANVI